MVSSVPSLAQIICSSSRSFDHDKSVPSAIVDALTKRLVMLSEAVAVCFVSSANASATYTGMMSSFDRKRDDRVLSHFALNLFSASFMIVFVIAVA